MGGLYFLMQYTTNLALVYVSYPTQLVFSNLRLIGIYLVGILFPRRSPRAKTLDYGKLKVGLLITAGIFIFNYHVLQP